MGRGAKLKELMGKKLWHGYKQHGMAWCMLSSVTTVFGFYEEWTSDSRKPLCVVCGMVGLKCVRVNATMTSKIVIGERESVDLLGSQRQKLDKPKIDTGQDFSFVFNFNSFPVHPSMHFQFYCDRSYLFHHFSFSILHHFSKFRFHFENL